MVFLAPPTGYTATQLTAADRREVLETVHWAFPHRHSVDEFMAEPDHMPWERAFGYRDPAGRLVATCASFAFDDCPLPGTTAPVAGLTWVAVHPEHRRRGLLSAMIKQHLAQCAAQGQALSMLTATEAVIYGRFGYGQASSFYSLTLPRQAALRGCPGSDEIKVRFETYRVDEHRDLVNRLHRLGSRTGAWTRPGWVYRTSPSVEESIVLERDALVKGLEEQRLLIAERAGEPVGYALWRRDDQCWEEPGATVKLQELVGDSPQVHHALWSRILDLDLTGKVVMDPAQLDEPLLSLLVDLNDAHAKLYHLQWVRLVDVPQALAQRQYAADIDAVLEVRDTRLAANAGRWRLQAAAFSDQVAVSPTTAAADLALDVRELGGAYLGGTSLMSLGGAGLVEELTPGSLARASVAFGWPVAPGCNWFF